MILLLFYSCFCFFHFSYLCVFFYNNSQFCVLFLPQSKHTPLKLFIMFIFFFFILIIFCSLLFQDVLGIWLITIPHLWPIGSQGLFFFSFLLIFILNFLYQWFNFSLITTIVNASSPLKVRWFSSPSKMTS